MLVGIGLSLLLHASVFWLLSAQMLAPDLTPPADQETRLTVSLAPPGQPAPPQTVAQVPAVPQKPPAKPAATRKPARKPVPAPRRDRAQPAETPAAVPHQESAQADILPSDDMFTHLQAARKRRAEASAQAAMNQPMPKTQAPAQDDNRIALANIATSLQRAGRADAADSGGVFQLRRVGYRDAEVFFRGWSTDAKRDRTRLLTVEQGAETDIQTAVVKKMIEVIREERSEDFTWDSRRLGKVLTLSARPQDSAALEQFLMQEFFPQHAPG